MNFTRLLCWVSVLCALGLAARSVALAQTEPFPECCEPITVADELEICSDKRQPPSYAPSTNGCGPQDQPLLSSAINFVAGFGTARFIGACDGHDECYGTCEADKQSCDSSFWQEMVAECIRSHRLLPLLHNGLVTAQCVTLATVFYGAVDLGGAGPYQSGQLASCSCCDTCHGLDDAGVPDGGFDASSDDAGEGGAVDAASGDADSDATTAMGDAAQALDLTPPNSAFAAAHTGDPHLRTFDGLYYDLQAVGELTLVKDERDGLEVQVRTRPWGMRNDVSVTIAVAARVGTSRVVLNLGDEMRLDGVSTVLDADGTHLPSGGAVYRVGGDRVVRWPDGSQVRVSELGDHMNVRLFLSDERSAKVVGLLGTFTKTSIRVLKYRTGEELAQPATFEDFYGRYAESWRILQADSLFDYAAGETTETFTDRAFPRRLTTLDSFGSAARDAALAACRAAGVTAPGLLAACALDIAATNDTSFATGFIGLPEPTEVLAVQPPVSDADGDGVPAARDNCPAQANPLQHDQNADGQGDACEPDGGPYIIAWTDWTAAAASAATGNAGDVAVSYSGEIDRSSVANTPTYFGGASFTSVQVANAPPGDFIGLIGGGTAVKRLMFATPVKDPYLAVFSVGQPSTPRTYEFDAPFEILSQGAGAWGGGRLTTRDGYVLEGTEGNGVLRFKGTFSSLSWTVPIAETWSGFTVGAGAAP